MKGLGLALDLALLGLARRRRGGGAWPPRRVLVLGYAAVGDLLFLMPALEAMRRAWPRAEVTFLANRYPTTTELVPAAGLADEVWFWDWEGPEAAGGRPGVNARIAARGFDLAVLSPAAPAHYFQEGLAAVPSRAGHVRPWEGGPWSGFKRFLVTGEWARRALLDRRAWVSLAPEHALLRNLRLLDALGLERPGRLPRPRLPLNGAHRAKAGELLGPARKRVGVHLGPPGGQYGKFWPPERFGELCRTLSKRSGAEFVLVGGPEEEPSAAKALSAFPGFKSAVGRLSLLESFAAVESCALFLSNDTGLAKAAMALSVPTATWWGPSDPAEYGAVWDEDKHLDIRTAIWCSPCSRMGMPRLGADLDYLRCGHHDCLAKLEVGFALKALESRYAGILLE